VYTGVSEASGGTNVAKSPERPHTESAPGVDQMLKMPKAELDELFSGSPAGRIPQGRGRGTVLFAPGTLVARLVAKLAYALAWRGKVFDPERGDLLNIVSPFGIKAIRARVYRDPSWIDEQECIVLDYSKTSFVARWIRDEIREVSPGVFLGQVFWSKAKILKFALVFPRR
jgi:hypothetical protein